MEVCGRNDGVFTALRCSSCCGEAAAVAVVVDAAAAAFLDIVVDQDVAEPGIGREYLMQFVSTAMMSL